MQTKDENEAVPENIQKCAEVVRRGLDFVDEEELLQVLSWWAAVAIGQGINNDVVPKVYTVGLLQGLGVALSTFVEQARHSEQATDEDRAAAEAVETWLNYMRGKAATEEPSRIIQPH